MRKLFLIAGHNGKGTGASGFLDEGEETIVFRDILDSCVCSHNIIPETDFDRENEKLADVVKWLKSNVKQNDVCIDIHFNASSNVSAHGTEVLIPDKFSDFEKSLASEVLTSIVSILGTSNRGVKTESQSAHSSLAMLSGFDCEQILIEICFCTNSSDVDSYKKFKHELAKNLASVIVKHLK